jgi:hypothetical protein
MPAKKATATARRIRCLLIFITPEMNNIFKNKK